MIFPWKTHFVVEYLIQHLSFLHGQGFLDLLLLPAPPLPLFLLG